MPNNYVPWLKKCIRYWENCILVQATHDIFQSVCLAKNVYNALTVNSSEALDDLFTLKL